MADLRSGIEYLREVFREREAVTVTYRRGLTSFSVSATPSRTQAGVDSRTGLRPSMIELKDWIIDRAELVTGFADDEAQPMQGDEIVETDGDLEHTFETTATEGRVDVWDWFDLYRNAYRIHSARVLTEPA